MDSRLRGNDEVFAELAQMRFLTDKKFRTTNLQGNSPVIHTIEKFRNRLDAPQIDFFCFKRSRRRIRLLPGQQLRLERRLTKRSRQSDLYSLYVGTAAQRAKKRSQIWDVA
jgi:hypothetical protein